MQNAHEIAPINPSTSKYSNLALSFIWGVHQDQGDSLTTLGFKAQCVFPDSSSRPVNTQQEFDKNAAR
jgi:hypothetical protein